MRKDSVLNLVKEIALADGFTVEENVEFECEGSHPIGVFKVTLQELPDVHKDAEVYFFIDGDRVEWFSSFVGAELDLGNIEKEVKECLEGLAFFKKF
jgi:hypothetical protein